MPVIVVGKHSQLVIACLRMGINVIQVDTARLRECQSAVECDNYVPMVTPSLNSEDVVSTILSDPPSAVEKVITGAEQGILACGAMNDFFGSEGLSGQQAWSSRHKPRQKHLLAQHGVAVARGVSFINRDCDAMQVVAMAADAGFCFPLILKPAIGGGARGVSFVDDVATLDARMRSHNDSQVLLAEEYVAGDEWHVDGFLSNGLVKHILVSRYGQPLLTTKTGHSVRSFPISSVCHEALYTTCAELIVEVFDALSISTTAFHVELFLIDGKIIVGEVASRPGGGLIPEMCTAMGGFNLWSAVAGDESSVRSFSETRNSECHAFTILAAPSERYRPVTEEELRQISGVHAVRMRSQPDQSAPNIRAVSTNGLAYVHVVGQSPEHCETVMDEIEDFIRSA
jgi:biotin carboxylase